MIVSKHFGKIINITAWQTCGPQERDPNVDFFKTEVWIKGSSSKIQLKPIFWF